jgi:hypothetical protein
MIVTASSPAGLMNACLDAIQRFQAPGLDLATLAASAAVSPPGGGIALPEVTDAGARQPTTVVSPLSGTLARQAYQAQAAAVRQASLAD